MFQSLVGPGYVNIEISGDILETDDFDIWSDATPTGPGSMTMVGDAIYDGTNGKCYDSSYESEICQVEVAAPPPTNILEGGEISGTHSSAWAELGTTYCGSGHTSNTRPVAWPCDGLITQTQMADIIGPFLFDGVGAIGDADGLSSALSGSGLSSATMVWGPIDIIFSCYSHEVSSGPYKSCHTGVQNHLPKSQYLLSVGVPNSKAIMNIWTSFGYDPYGGAYRSYVGLDPNEETYYLNYASYQSVYKYLDTTGFLSSHRDPHGNYMYDGFCDGDFQACSTWWNVQVQGGSDPNAGGTCSSAGTQRTVRIGEVRDPGGYDYLYGFLCMGAGSECHFIGFSTAANSCVSPPCGSYQYFGDATSGMKSGVVACTGTHLPYGNQNQNLHAASQPQWSDERKIVSPYDTPMSYQGHIYSIGRAGASTSGGAGSTTIDVPCVEDSDASVPKPLIATRQQTGTQPSCTYDCGWLFHMASTTMPQGYAWTADSGPLTSVPWQDEFAAAMPRGQSPWAIEVTFACTESMVTSANGGENFQLFNLDTTSNNGIRLGYGAFGGGQGIVAKYGLSKQWTAAYAIALASVCNGKANTVRIVQPDYLAAGNTPARVQIWWKPEGDVTFTKPQLAHSDGSSEQISTTDTFTSFTLGGSML